MRKVYYGWWIVGACSLILFVCAGIGFSTSPVFFDYLLRDISNNRRVISLAAALAALSAGLWSPVVGWILDRHGPRAVMLPGAVTLSAAFFLMGQISKPIHLHLLNMAIGLGLAATTILPCQTVVSRWFERRRGRAMGMITTGTAVGTVVWIWASSRMIKTIGWRSAYEALGIIIAVISIPLIFFVIRTSPQSMGLALDSSQDSTADPSGGTSHIAAEEPGYTMREAFRTPSFWLIVCATFFVVVASSGFGLHAVTFLSGQGMAHTRASDIWAATHLVSIAGRFFFGYLSEKYQKRYFASIANMSRTICIVALILFAVGTAPQATAIVLLVVVYGLGVGCNAVINPLLVSETFGVKSFGKIMGVLGLPYTIGMGLGMYGGGHLFYLQDSYNFAFAVFAVCFVVAGISIALAKPRFLLDGATGILQPEDQSVE